MKTSGQFSWNPSRGNDILNSEFVKSVLGFQNINKYLLEMAFKEILRASSGRIQINFPCRFQAFNLEQFKRF